MRVQKKPFLDIFEDVSRGNMKTLQKDFLEEGNIPIVDQGQKLIAGYTNDRASICKAKLPVIIFGDHTKIIKYVDFEFAIGADGVKVLTTKEKGNVKYFYHALKFARIPDAGYSRHYKFLKEIEVCFPPLMEQKRIAAILDAAEALRAKRRQILKELDTFLQATFLHMFGDPVTNPKGWEHKLLGEVTTIEAPMVDPRKEEYRDLLHYGPDRIGKNTGELLPALTAKEDRLVSGKFLCSEKDILYSKIRPYLNKVALVREKCLCSADVYPVQPNEKFITKEFLWVLLRSKAFLDYVAGFSRRANIPKINREQFAGYLSFLPPLALQQQFAAIVESVERQKVAMKAHLAELDDLFGSLQQRAFNGEL